MVEWLERQSEPALTVLCGVAIALIGVLHLRLGSMVQFSIFYLWPVGLAAWFASARAAVLLSAWAAALSFSIEVSLSSDADMVVVAWNSAARFALLMFVALLLSQLRAQLAREHKLAETDSLTGVWNRRAFWTALEREAERARRYDLPVSVLYLDIDNFKRLNDSQGHAEGDRVLCEVARVLLSSCRGSDSVARLGGDEFAVLCPEADQQAAAAVAHKIHNAVGDILRRSCNVTVSLGVSTFGSVPQDLGQLMRRADSSMYLAKHAGKDQVHHAVYRSELGDLPSTQA